MFSESTDGIEPVPKVRRVTQESTSRRAKRPLDVLTEWASQSTVARRETPILGLFDGGEFFPSRQQARPQTRGGPFQLAQASRARFGKKKMVRPPPPSVPASRPTSPSSPLGRLPVEAKMRS